MLVKTISFVLLIGTISILAQQELYINNTLLTDNQQYLTRGSDLDLDGRLDIFNPRLVSKDGKVTKQLCFYGNCDNLSGEPDLIFFEEPSGGFAHSFDSGGDINGDGYQDLVVGESQYYGYGRVFIYFGSEEMDNIADLVIYGSDNLNGYQGYTFFGGQVDISGDFNGDGVNDLFVHAKGDDMAMNGFIHIFLGGEEINTVNDQFFIGEVGELLGSKISIGDLNGDNYSDIIATRTNYNMPQKHMKLFKGSENGIIDDNILYYSDTTLFHFNCEGDFNGDGRNELLLMKDANTIRINYFDENFNIEQFMDFSLGSGIVPICSIPININGDNYSDLLIGRLGIGDTPCVIYTGPLNSNGSFQYKLKNDSSNPISAPFNYFGDIFNKGYDYIIAGPEPSQGDYLSNLIVRDIEDSDIIESEITTLRIVQNYPNPFNPTTSIGFATPQAGMVKLNIYNSNGELVETILDENLSSGSHKIEFNGSSYSSGTYFYQLETETKILSKRMVLIK